MSNVLGRIHYQEKLHKILTSKKAELLAVYGRRRVGKTFLIREYFHAKKVIFFQVVGKKDGSMHEQLAIFAEALEATFYADLGVRIQAPNNWHEALALLNRAISSLAANKTVVIFMDELPWLATRKSNLLDELDHYWNGYWSSNANIKMIVCGSAASWIIDNIINARGGLHNRLTGTLLVKPFTLAEIKNYLRINKFRYSDTQILTLCMILGGIPYYLSLLDPKLSLPQNIHQLCFAEDGELRTEFNRLYASLFEHAAAHEEIVQILATSHSGLERSEILKASKLSVDGGTFSKRITELTEAGFIEKIVPLGKSRGVYYRLQDEYSLFYLDWVAPILGKHIDEHYWPEQAKSQKFKIWSSYAFESICRKHLSQIRKALKIPPGSVASSWQYRGNKDQDGAQIDLVFDRDDSVMTLCEISFRQQLYTIDKQYAKQLQIKADIFRKQFKPNKDIFFSMITTHGIKANMYSEELIASSATLKDLFTEV